jgi:oxygen-independent coproporphyrinogen-3 oxidase
MCQGEIDIAAIEHRYDIDFHVYFEGALRELDPLIDDGLATDDGEFIKATSRGRLLLRIIAMCFDAYLKPSSATAYRPIPGTAQTPRYSKVI